VKEAPDLSAPPVGRLAPSPTGLLHVGHARSFLLAWWSLRGRGGRVILRVEDLDVDRVKPGMVEACLADLEWLGLDWDEGPLLQSQNTAPMQEALTSLVERELAYPCTCSRKEIQAALSAPHPGCGETRYPGTCRFRYLTVSEAEASSGRTAGLRFRVPPGEIRLHDAFHGPFVHDVQSEVGDFLIARRDGQFAYQLAVVVDDARQGVTEVLRGADLLSSTPRQWLLQRALLLPHPTWIHVPLVLDETGERLAKRRDSLALAALRERGVDPRRLVAWLARSCGLPCTEPATAAELLPEFSLERLPSDPVPFTAADLAALRPASS
jgi:glutamyl-tRNA synthetase